ncbi:Piwi-domain-containing protein [Phellopilus nigrolimitatus]|nr:Piwi-domain-containing protein [Phellopilus nigrolimitatus]
MAFEIARRPGMGRAGKHIDIISNTYEVKSFPTAIIYHYDVGLMSVEYRSHTAFSVIIPEIKNPRRANEIMQRLQLHSAPHVFQRPAAFDGAKNLFALTEPLFNEGAMTFIVNMSDRPPTGPNPRGVFQVTLKKVGEIRPGDLNVVLSGNAGGMPMTTTPLQVLNVLIQQAAALLFPVHTKQKFYIEEGRDNFGGFEIWRGFFQSIRPSLKRLIVNVDMATGVMYQRGPLPDFLLSFFHLKDERQLSGLDEGHPQWTRVKSVLKGLKVKQAHSGRLRTIRSIVSNAGGYTFTLKNGDPTTVSEYFLKHHQISLRNPRMPGIITTREEVIPFELCVIKEGQLFKKKTSPELMAKMLTFSKKRPNERFSAIQDGMTRLQLGNSPYIVQAGMSISSQAMNIQGRVLEPPSMGYGGQADLLKPKAGSWNMVNRLLKDPMPIKTWGAISLDPGVQENEIQNFIIGLMNAMVAVAVAKPPIPIIRANPTEAHREMHKLCTEFVNRTKNPPTILIVVLPQNAAQIRKDVKQYGDIHYGIVTQCVRADKMRTANNQYCNNLILKINAKLGGTNAVPSGTSFDWFKNGKTMVMGADVTHPGPGVLRPSVAALVSSVDESAAKYVCRCSVQEPRLEIIEDLQAMVTYALEMFNKYRSFVARRSRPGLVPLWPERLVFYRDGVSEGEIQQVVEQEIKQIDNALQELFKETGVRAKLTFIVVGKRHHIRFMPKRPMEGDRSGNAPAGLVVDEHITAPGLFDFYLQSHAGLLGTSRPSHYIVVKDENEFDADRLQGFSFTLCHTYARATRSVSIPAPCYCEIIFQIACARADYHFDPSLNFADDLSSDGGQIDMEAWRKGFSRVHANQATNMYFM